MPEPDRTVTVKVECPECHGSGDAFDWAAVRKPNGCPYCTGSGTRMATLCDPEMADLIADGKMWRLLIKHAAKDIT